MSVGGGFSAYALERLSKDPQFILYRAREPASRRRVLLFAPASENLPQHILKRIEHEYALRAELDSAWAAMPIALAHDGGRTILVRKDPGGEPLDQLLERPFDLRQFLRIAIGLTTALAAMHERRIVHRDIRPANILVNAASGKVWLTGFGVATGPLRQPQAPEPSATVGATLAYMAPEQTGRMNRSIDTRSDLFRSESPSIKCSPALCLSLPPTLSNGSIVTSRGSRHRRMSEGKKFLRHYRP